MARKTKEQKIADMRIQRAVSGGFQIPLTSIVALYNRLQVAIDAGHSDESLKAIVGEFPGVVKVER